MPQWRHQMGHSTVVYDSNFGAFCISIFVTRTNNVVACCSYFSLNAGWPKGSPIQSTNKLMKMYCGITLADESKTNGNLYATSRLMMMAASHCCYLAFLFVYIWWEKYWEWWQNRFEWIKRKNSNCALTKASNWLWYFGELKNN